MTVGIIPARAGFTLVSAALRRRRPDHPRSRGVYALGELAHEADHGSSPLARGLPGFILVVLSVRGIIPARAGFTTHLPNFGTFVPDHPRSRGVYASGDDPIATRVGSSPLARGLLSPSPVCDARHGIIPARAGFTAGSPTLRPRASGSSPLARGLPRRVSPSQPMTGIIPARAGFTSRARAR